MKIGDRLVSVREIVTAEIDTRHYVNGSESTLVVNLTNGHQLRIKHGYGFDAFGTLKEIEAAMDAAPRGSVE